LQYSLSLISFISLLSALAIPSCVSPPSPAGERPARPSLVVATPASQTAVASAAAATATPSPVPGALAPSPSGSVVAIGQLVAPLPQTRQGFATSVAVSGDTIVVGAPRATHAGQAEAGVAYIYVQDKSHWQLQQILTPPNSQPYDRFGETVAILKDTIVINSPHRMSVSPRGKVGVGQVFVYTRNGTKWYLQAMLHDLLLSQNNISPGDRENYPFGLRFTITQDAIIVSGKSDKARLHSFTKDNNSWKYQSQVDNDCGEHTPLEYSFSSSGTVLAIGPYQDSQKHSDESRDTSYYSGVCIFERQNGVWIHQNYLSHAYDNYRQQEDYGRCVALSGNTLAVGAPRKLQPGHAGPGEVDIYVRSGSSWAVQTQLRAKSGHIGDEFGRSLALSGDHLVVGSRDVDIGFITIHFFARRGTGWQQVGSHTQDSSDHVPSLAMDGDLVVMGASEGKAITPLPERALLFRFSGG